MPIYCNGSRCAAGAPDGGRSVIGVPSACTQAEMEAYLETRKGVTMSMSNVTSAGATLTFAPFTGRYLSYIAGHQMPTFQKSKHGFVYVVMLAQIPRPQFPGRALHDVENLEHTRFINFTAASPAVSGITGKYWDIPKTGDFPQSIPRAFHVITYEEARNGRISLDASFVPNLLYESCGKNSRTVRRNRLAAMTMERNKGIGGIENKFYMPYSQIY